MGEVKKDEVVDRFETYEEYLNMFITEDDMLYLGEEEIARNIIAGFDDIIYLIFHLPKYFDRFTPHKNPYIQFN